MPQKNQVSPGDKRVKRVTLQDIADVAGVQKMAVSNALNGKRSVAPATRERILRIADELSYIPNFAARALSQGRTGIVAVISGPLNEPYYGAMVHLLEGHFASDGFHLMLMRTPGEVRDLVNATGNLAVDGVVAIDRINLVKEFRAHPTIPCVSISTNPQSFVDNVFVDLSASIEQAIALMLAQNRRRVAYLVTADSLALDEEVRAHAYRSSMRRAGRALEIINVATDDLDELERNFQTYLEINGCPDALLCQNDETAICAFGVLKQRGRAVPDDVLLVGCDGQRHMKYFDPPLSTIVQPMEEICALAWKFLGQRIADPSLARQSASVCSKLLVRESLGRQSSVTNARAA